MGNIVSSVYFCFQDRNYAYATRQGILTKIRAREHLQKFLRAIRAKAKILNPSQIEWVHSIPLIIHIAILNIATFGLP